MRAQVQYSIESRDLKRPGFRILNKRDSEEYCTLYPTDNQPVLTLDQVMVALEVRLSGMMNLQVMLAVKPGVM